MAFLAFRTHQQVDVYVVPLGRGRTVIGRDASCDGVLGGATVSRRHCLVDVAGAEVWVTDVSRHGTWLNGQRMEPRARVLAAFGDVIGVGAFQGELRSSLESPAPTAEFAHDAAPVCRGGIETFGELVGRSESMRRVLDQLRRAATHAHPVSICGESGTGKELAARALHTEGARAGAPWVVLNCAGLTDTLFESELFGHEAGAFTGATQQTDGAFRAAAGGTLFLDEVGELPLSLQPKLLRVLESGEVRRVGASTPDFPDVRLVTATNRDLLEMVHAGAFRQDLYFRIAQVRIEMPPLRTRPVDIRAITRALLDHMVPAHALTRKARDQLLAYPWPGNVRQLRNVLQVAAAETPPGRPISEATIERHLPAVHDRTRDPDTLRATYEARGSIRATADALDVPYPTMRRRLIKHGIVVPKPASSGS